MKPPAEYCAKCGHLVPDPEHEFEGPTPIDGEPERGFLCNGCNEEEEGERAIEQSQGWAEEMIPDMTPVG